MNITTNKDGGKLTIGLEGRLDTTSAPQLEGILRESLRGVTDLVMDFAQLAYISSAGLRVLLAAMKLMKKQGTMVVRNVNETVMEVFEITGFADMLTIE
jgi:anti-sigma B factor antagonist